MFFFFPLPVFVSTIPRYNEINVTEQKTFKIQTENKRQWWGNQAKKTYIWLFEQMIWEVEWLQG